MSNTLTSGTESTSQVSGRLSDSTFMDTSSRLHDYMFREHWKDGAVRGPDSGIRFNARIGRFIKGYLNFVPWDDNYTYIQGQSYWIRSNWLMHELTGDEKFRQIAVQGSEFVYRKQRPEGYWEYPNPEWKSRIATVEGCFGSLAMLESYRHTRREEFLESALKFYEYLLEHIGFRRQPDSQMLAINYFAHRDREAGGVPNNSTLLLWTLAELAQATGDSGYMDYCPPMIRWLEHVQLPTGELPYDLGKTAATDRNHFLCHQYNSFEFMDLVYYTRLTGDDSVRPIMENLACFLANGLTGSGFCRYNCHSDTPEVTYYTVALGRALATALEEGVDIDPELPGRLFHRVLPTQRDDGGFQFFSRYNYRILADRRSYPRNLAMMLYHFLSQANSIPPH